MNEESRNKSLIDRIHESEFYQTAQEENHYWLQCYERGKELLLDIPTGINSWKDVGLFYLNFAKGMGYAALAGCLILYEVPARGIVKNTRSIGENHRSIAGNIDRILKGTEEEKREET